MQNLNVKAFIQLVGINANTLRAWERRHHALHPHRDANGRRNYTTQDLERARVLTDLVKSGHAISKIASLSTDELNQRWSVVRDLQMDQSQQKGITPQPIPTIYLEKIITHLESFDLEGLSQCLLRSRFELSPKEISLNLVLPLMKKVGVLVASCKLSIAQEHILSSFLRDYLGALYLSLSPYDFSSRLTSKKVALATREGDLHEFGILLASILCCVHRFRTHYFGVNMPANELSDACVQFKIDFLILGVSKLPKADEKVKAMTYLSLLDKTLPKKITLCLGGSEMIQTDRLKSGRKIIFFSSLQELDSYLDRVCSG